MYSEISSKVQCGNVEGKCAICQVTGLPAKCQRGVPCLHTTSRAVQRISVFRSHITSTLSTQYLHSIYTTDTKHTPPPSHVPGRQHTYSFKYSCF